jgi:hypothetical protein
MVKCPFFNGEMSVCNGEMSLSNGEMSFFSMVKCPFSMVKCPFFNDEMCFFISEMSLIIGEMSCFIGEMSFFNGEMSFSLIQINFPFSTPLHFRMVLTVVVFSALVLFCVSCCGYFKMIKMHHLFENSRLKLIFSLCFSGILFLSFFVFSHSTVLGKRM